MLHWHIVQYKSYATVTIKGSFSLSAKAKKFSTRNFAFSRNERELKVHRHDAQKVSRIVIAFPDHANKDLGQSYEIQRSLIVSVASTPRACESFFHFGTGIMCIRHVGNVLLIVAPRETSERLDGYALLQKVWTTGESEA